MGDYSDPDVIRVGEDYYLISSSFTYLPGIPVLHSKDLLHWEQIGNAVSRLPFERYDRPVHKCGTFAPSLRYHNGTFYVYVTLPDEGLFCFTAKDPAGEWETHFVKDVCGWIDPCPLFDDDGSVYLIHGFAGSRSGINNILYMHRLSPDGFRVLDFGRPVYLGDDHGDDTVEGPKLYKRGGYYYILCPAGGVKRGYQLALRARNIYGPYERRVVLSQGATSVNGPHQGGWIDTGTGEDWFIHFRDAEEYGRVPYLQPVHWLNDWPEMGTGGEPVLEYEAPKTGNISRMGLMMSDDFEVALKPEWQWQANPDARLYEMLKPGIRLYADKAKTPFEAVGFLSKLMQAFDFDMETGVNVSGNCKAGVCMMGYEYHYIALEHGFICIYAGKGEDHGRSKSASVSEKLILKVAYNKSSAVLGATVRNGRYSFTLNGAPVGNEYRLTAGGWTGARPGIFCIDGDGFADFEGVHFTDEKGNRI